VSTALEPHALLAELKRIERELGRETTYRWGPRVIDLDILTYDDVQMATDDLTIPHPRLAERAFVLVPLAEIDERYVLALEALPEDDRRGVVALADVP
jgi:2-amino-4-hydroxy-6-hydroxymethyldihydropteridine diphosphokinase